MTRSDERDRILRAAVRVFARKGFFNADVDDVSRAARVTTAAVLRQFEGKDDLLVSIFDWMIGEALDEGRRALQSIDDPIARLDEIARIHLARIGRDRDLAIVCQVESRQSIRFMERFSSTRLREYLGIVRDAIGTGQHRGVFRDGLKPTVAAKLFFGMLDEMATDWILSARRYTLEAESALVVDLFVNGLASRPVTAVPSRERAPAKRATRRVAK